MNYYLSIIQIAISLLLIVTILLQPRGSGGSVIFGGGGGASYYTKRGMAKVIFVTSIVLAVLFLATAFLALLI